MRKLATLFKNEHPSGLVDKNYLLASLTSVKHLSLKLYLDTGAPEDSIDIFVNDFGADPDASAFISANVSYAIDFPVNTLNVTNYIYKAITVDYSSNTSFMVGASTNGAKDTLSIDFQNSVTCVSKAFPDGSTVPITIVALKKNSTYSVFNG